MQGKRGYHILQLAMRTKNENQHDQLIEDQLAMSYSSATLTSSEIISQIEKDKINEYAYTNKPTLDNDIINILSPHNYIKQNHDNILAEESFTEDCTDTDNDPNYEISESNSLSELDENVTPEQSSSPKRSRKRLRNEWNWKVNIRKMKRMAGLQYTSSKNREIPAKTMQPPCFASCKKKCAERFSEEVRKNIFDNFYKNSFDNNMKRLYVANRVSKEDVERRRSRTGDRENRRNHSLKYSFNINGKDELVCKTFFCNTLSISQSYVEVALKKKIEGGNIIEDLRGKHTPSNKLHDSVRDSVRKHIGLFPVIDSHYSREQSSRKYLGNDLNISKMYELYLIHSQDNQIPEETIAKKWVYSNVFNTEFNYAFKQPSNDTCETCDEFILKIKQSTSSEKELAQIDYDQHLIEAKRRYKMKSEDKSNSKLDKRKKVIMIDLQKCLPTPYLTNSQAFYLCKLWTLNLTIYDATNHNTVCTMWDETIAGRGGSEIASCINRWAEMKLQNGDSEAVEELTIWSDNCGGQNRNYIMVSLYFSLLKQYPLLKTINHKFLLKGHTHMEVDVQHSIIERAKQKLNKNNLEIMIPWDWQQFIRGCSSVNNVLEVYNMELHHFKNFKSLHDNTCAPLMIRKRNNLNENVLISEMVHMQVRRENIGVLYYKTSFNDENFKSVDFNRCTRRANVWPEDLPLCRNTLRPIGLPKFNDLQTALKWVPKCFHNFYANIPYVNNTRDYPDEENT